jgi:hypothetical protein
MGVIPSGRWRLAIRLSGSPVIHRSNCISTRAPAKAYDTQRRDVPLDRIRLAPLLDVYIARIGKGNLLLAA